MDVLERRPGRDRLVLGDMRQRKGRINIVMEPPRRGVLPPLLKGGSVTKTKKKITRALHDTLKEEEPWRVRKSSKHISVDIDRRVVDHLKRRLVERVERRSINENSEGYRKASHRADRVKLTNEPFDIFSKYSDTGDILNKKLLKAKRFSLCGGLTPLGDIKQRISRSTINNESDSRITPNDNQTPTDAEDDKNQKISVETDPNLLSLEKEITTLSDIIKRGEGDTFVLTNYPKHELKGGEIVSPIATPYIWRQDTREQLRLTNLERKMKILHGSVHVMCPPECNTVRIYVSSGASDFEEERGTLLERVYPKLREFCQRKGCDLDICDLHWGARDAVWDDPITSEFYQRHLEQCLSSSIGFTTLYLVGQKYGANHLPCTIPCDEFIKILEAAKEEEQRIRDLLSEEKLESVEGVETANRVGGLDAIPEESSPPPPRSVEGVETANGVGGLDAISEESTPPPPRVSLSMGERGVVHLPKEHKLESVEGVETANGVGGLDAIPEESTPPPPRESAPLEESIASTLSRDVDTLNESRDSTVTHRRRVGSVIGININKAAKAARDALEHELISADILEKWYKLDENERPPVYRLQNVSTHLSGLQRNDAGTRAGARSEWREARDKLCALFSKMAPKCLIDERDRRKYTTSVLDLEIERGLLEVDNEENHAIAIIRDFEPCEEMLTDPVSGDFNDMLPRKPEIDLHLREKINNLKESVIPERIPPRHVYPHTLPWKPEGIDPTRCRPHFNYLDKMCRAVYDDLTKGISQDMASRNGLMAEGQEELYDEVSTHVRHLQYVTSEFQGRKDVLTIIKAYLRSHYTNPLVIFGTSGCGKTAVMGKAAKDAHKWFRGVSVNVVVRTIGVTSRSCNIRELLADLNRQLSIIYNLPTHNIPTDLKGLSNYFAQVTGKSRLDNPLFIFIDSLDQLSAENDGRKLNWLPKEGHTYTKIILSTNMDAKYECLNILKKLYIQSECFLQIPDISGDDSIKIVDHWLARASRKLTETQKSALMGKVTDCRSPLFLKLTFVEFANCASYIAADKIKLGATVKKMAALKFGMLEREFSEPFVRRCLGYITASRNGLTTNEMIDVLSIDEAVMDDVTTSFNLTKRRFPQILWIRLLDRLQAYVLHRKTDGVITIRWRHTEIHDAAVERYIDAKDRGPSYHKILAEYFLGSWFNVPKPFSTNEEGLPRFVMSQAITVPVDADDDDDKQSVLYNLRRLNELPYHLINSQQMDLLKREVLCNFDFLQGKVYATSIDATLEEVQTALSVDSLDIEVKLLSDTLQLSAKVLQRDPKQLASQIVGRLHQIITKDVPVSHADPIKYPYLQMLFNQAHKSPFPSLIPSNLCLTEPGGVLFDLLSGHGEPITAVTVTSGGMQAVTTSMDGTLKVWDLRSGRVTKTIPGIKIGVRALKLAMNNMYALISYVDSIEIWSLRSSKCVFAIDQYEDPPIIATADDGKLLIAVFDGSNVMRVWNLEKDPIEMMNEKLLLSDNVHKNNSIVICGNVYGDTVLYAARGSKAAHVQKARTGKVVCSLECNEPSSLITALGVSRDYFIIACRQQYMKLHEIHQLELFDNRKATYLRSVRGCMSDVVNELHINQAGSHAMAICSSEQTNLSDIAIWNLETDEHKHMGRHSGVSTMCACIDFRFCLSAGKGDNTLRIWNLSKDINKPAPKQSAATGIGEIIPMVNNQRYLVARGQNNGPITVWNVAKAKCLSTAVRIERGLSDSHDVVLVRKTKVIILTDRGFSTVDSKPIFQTIMIYDLKAKKYDKRITGCFITPSPVSEYVLLEHHLLLGLSDNRTHFIVWNLHNGMEVYRIRTNFRELDKTLDAPNKAKEHHFKPRATTAKMTPWDRRSETVSARDKRRVKEKNEDKIRLDSLKKERENAIDRYIISKDESTIVASYYAHHLCVFNLETKSHTMVIEDETSMLFLYTSALTKTGSHMVLTNYDEENKTSYVTIWDCGSGQVKRRAKNETNVCVMAVSDDANKVVFGKTTNELRIWEPMKPNSMKRIKCYPGQIFSTNSKIVIFDENRQAIVYAGDISVWDLTTGTVIAVFSPDTNIQCFSPSLDGKIMSFGLADNPSVVTLKLMSKTIVPVVDTEGEELFGETTGDTTDEDDDDEEEG